MDRFEIFRNEAQTVESIGLFSFPAYRSAEWLEQHRLMPAVPGCLDNVSIEPQTLLNYANSKAYALKADAVRAEIRNALFRQALFKIQNIEVVASNKCPKYRILREIVKNSQPWYRSNVLQSKAFISEELWQIDRCGSLQSYKVVIRGAELQGISDYIWGLFRGKSSEEPGDFTEAHMGDENNFYYNEELKCWVVRGEEEKVARAAGDMPPPPRALETDAHPTVGSTESATRRGRLTSDKLYTQIPGVEVMESKAKLDMGPLVPLTAKSQFTPDTVNDESNNDYDFTN
ncbi:COPII coat assembly protein SEC16 [Babesia caballi]|uniref:COPII coat assembly protein SEC16 n=1 Tax=Babesia caballi TaxID=5871 RepID=A0AAV4LYP6_BABCB|nr:COPII coat assembly protein SEC16 [Babesia caballi]